MQLLEPITAYAKEILDYQSEFPPDEEIVGSSGLNAAADIETWLAQNERLKSWQTVPEGFVPGIEYLAVDTAKVVGMLNLRLDLNDYLLNYGGHIGYSVRPSQRKKGVGTQLLALGLQEARSAGLAKVLITCREDNIASAKIIERNGGVLEDKRFDASNGALMRRYWITLNQRR